MKAASFQANLDFDPKKVSTELILETSFTKEIRITFLENQYMKEHKTPFPIVVHLLQGTLEFGVKGQKTTLTEGDILSLEGNVPHDLFAISSCVVRLTLSKNDTATRVKNVVEN